MLIKLKMKLVNLDNIPHKPSATYKEWTSWPDFLNNGFDRDYVSYEEAKQICLENNIVCRNDYYTFKENGNLPKGLPSYPDGVYKNKGWVGWPEFFNLERRNNRKYRTIELAKEFLYPLKLHRTGYKEQFNTFPKDIPYRPDEYYKNNGWKNWADYLGNKSYKNIKMSSLEEAVNLMKRLIIIFNIKSHSQYKKLWDDGKIPESLPKSLNKYYKVNLTIFGFDCRNTGNTGFYNIEEFKGWCIKNNIKSSIDFKKLLKNDIENKVPRSPEAFYKKTNSWPGWPKLLDNGNERIEFISFVEAREWVHKQNITSFSDWQEFCKNGLKPKNIPSNPYRNYKNEWRGWGDWIGNGLGPNGKILNKTIYEINKLR
jgi:hypothetical protein